MSTFVRRFVAAAVLGSLVTAVGCSTTAGDDLGVVTADPAVRAPLLGAVAELEGRWLAESDFGTGEQIFSVGSNGSAVREVMNPGQPFEMTNMYVLEGNSLVMTHYCGAGNQPRMRATSIVDGRMEFESIGVGDLKSPDELYMGSMTLVFIDADTIEQHWNSVNAPAGQDKMMFTLRRAD